MAGQAKLRGGPDIDFALEHEFAAMQLDQGLGDRQAETGALVAARQMVFHLLKRLEYLLQMVAWNADPGILDRDHQISLAVAPATDDDAAARLGKFDGVGEKIEQDLLELDLIDPDQSVQSIVAAIDFDQLLFGNRTESVNDRVDQLGDRYGFFLEVDLAGLNPGQVENAIDQAEQIDRGLVNVLRVFGVAILRLLRVELDDLGKSDDRIERCPQFMGHVGKELGLGAVGCLGLPHLLLGSGGSRIRSLLGRDERQSGAPPIKQRAELRAIPLEQRFARTSSALRHHSSSEPS